MPGRVVNGQTNGAANQTAACSRICRSRRNRHAGPVGRARPALALRFSGFLPCEQSTQRRQHAGLCTIAAEHFPRPIVIVLFRAILVGLQCAAPVSGVGVTAGLDGAGDVFGHRGRQLYEGAVRIFQREAVLVLAAIGIWPQRGDVAPASQLDGLPVPLARRAIGFRRQPACDRSSRAPGARRRRWWPPRRRDRPLQETRFPPRQFQAPAAEPGWIGRRGPRSSRTGQRRRVRPRRAGALALPVPLDRARPGGARRQPAWIEMPRDRPRAGGRRGPRARRVRR